MSERALWATVRRHLGPYLDLVRVENRAGSGTLDLSWAGLGAEGWLELKHLHGWPIRPETPVVVRRLTLDQVTWLERRAARGGRAHLLLRVAREGYALLAPPAVRELYERRLTRDALHMVALLWATGRFPKLDVLRALTGRVIINPRIAPGRPR